MEKFQDLSLAQKKDYGLFLILLVYLGITPLFDAGLDHDVMYWLVLLAAPILLILTFRTKPTWTIDWKDPGLYLILLTFWAGASFFWSIHQLRTMIELIQLFSYVIAFFIMRNLDDEFKAKALRIGSITAVALAVFGILQFIFVKSGRVEATFPHPNPFGTYLAMFSLYLLGIQIRESSKIRFGAIVIMLTAIVLSGSKGTYLAILIAAPLAYLGIPKQSLKKPMLQTLLLATATGLSVACIFFLTPFLQDKIDFGTNLFEKVARVGALESSATDRIEFWRVSLELLKNRPLTGYGYGTFFAAHYIEYQVNETYTRFAHNHYLQLAAELGLPGIGLFIGFMVASLRLTIKQLKKQSKNLLFAGSLAACAIFLLHVLIEFSWNFPAVPIVFFALAGLVVGKLDEGNKVIFKFTFRLGSKTIASFIIISFLLTSWQISSNMINEKGYDISNKGQLEKGLEYYELANRIYPFSGRNLRLASLNHYSIYQKTSDNKSLTESINKANMAIELTPYSSNDYHLLAVLYVANNDLKKAEQQYLLADKYNAYNLRLYLDLASLFQKMLQDDKSLDALLNGSNRIDIAIGSSPDTFSQLSAIQEGILCSC